MSTSVPFAGTLAFASANDGNLYSVDLLTGVANLGGGLGVSLMEGLALSPTGQLYGTDSSGNFYIINRDTGAATLVGSTGRGNIEGLDSDGATLLGSTFSSSLAPTIFSINLATGATTDVITATTNPGVVHAMADVDANDVLVCAGTGSENLSSINLTTGVVTLIGGFSGTRVSSAPIWSGSI